MQKTLKSYFNGLTGKHAVAFVTASCVASMGLTSLKNLAYETFSPRVKSKIETACIIVTDSGEQMVFHNSTTVDALKNFTYKPDISQAIDACIERFSARDSVGLHSLTFRYWTIFDDDKKSQDFTFGAQPVDENGKAAPLLELGNKWAMIEATQSLKKQKSFMLELQKLYQMDSGSPANVWKQFKDKTLGKLDYVL